MSGSHRGLIGVVLFCLFALAAPPAAAQEADADKQWANFNHYVLIARPDLAQSAAEALLQVDDDTLLAAVEAGDYKDYDRTFVRAAKIDGLREASLKLEQKVQAARIGKSRDEARIAADIALLAEGQRPYRNAVQRLQAAGQFAAPQLLATLLDDKQKTLHPYIITAMVTVGRPMVTPLAIALPDVNPVAQRQIAQVLTQIGYPDPLPYLKQVMEDEQTDPDARKAVAVAYDQLSAKVDLPRDISAAGLFYILGKSQFRTATHSPDDFVGYDKTDDVGLLWTYGAKIGLVSIPVPGPIYGDVLAMRNAKHALKLNPAMDQALSLYLMANLRRENRLPDGVADPSYPDTMEPPDYYAMLAGPARVNDVLETALDNADAALALDAIGILAGIAGTDALINKGGAYQPLLRALSYPDRRVRFNAAVALGNARPSAAFDGSFRVVPVLAEAVRQSEDRYALVLADNQEDLNVKMAAMGDLGYRVIGGLSLTDVSGEVQSSPGVDLIVTDVSPDALSGIVAQTASDYKLGAVPILALVSAESLPRLSDWAADHPRVSAALDTDEPSDIREAVEAATASYVGQPMDAEEATAFSESALVVLRELALEANGIYPIADAQSALILALKDERPQIVEGAGAVLSLINNADAQQAVAAAALTAGGDEQISLLDSLSESATYFGNLLKPAQLDQITELVESSTGDTALAAARAYGALGLPTSDAVKMILK